MTQLSSVHICPCTVLNSFGNRELANNVSQMLLVKTRNIINQYERKPWGGGGGEFCLRTAFELGFLLVFLLN